MPNFQELFYEMMPNLTLLISFHIIYALTWGFNREIIKRQLGRFTHPVVGTLFGLGSVLLVERMTQGINDTSFLLFLTIFTVLGIFASKITYSIALFSVIVYAIFSPSLNFSGPQILMIVITTITILIMASVEEQKKAAYLFSTLTIFTGAFFIEIFANGISWMIFLFVKYIFIFVSVFLSYAMLAFIESIYIHAKTLQVISEYERGNIVRSALRVDALKMFVSENKIRFGFLSILGFQGIEEVRNGMGDEAVNELMEKVMLSLEEILHQENAIFFRSHDDKYGILLNYKNIIPNIKIEAEGNFLKKRQDDDVLSVMEIALEKLAVHYVVKGEWVKIIPHCGTAILGLHTNDIDEVVNYADFTLKTRNDSYTPNIVQLFDINKYLLFSKDSVSINKLKKIININSLYSGFTPMISLSSGKIHAYHASLVINGAEHLSTSEAYERAKKINLEIILTRLSAQISLRSYTQYKKYPLIIKYDWKALRHDFNPSEFINKVFRFGATTESIILRINVNELINIDKRLIENIEILQKEGIKFTVDSADKLGSRFAEFLSKIRPDYVTVSKALIRRIGSNADAVETLKMIVDYCKKNKILTSCYGITTKFHTKIINDCGVDFVSGFIFGETLPIPGKPNADIVKYIENNLNKA